MNTLYISRPERRAAVPRSVREADRNRSGSEAAGDGPSPDPAAASDRAAPHGSPPIRAPHQTAAAVGAMADAVRRALAEDRAEDDITTR